MNIYGSLMDIFDEKKDIYVETMLHALTSPHSG